MKKMPVSELLKELSHTWPEVYRKTNPFMLQLYRARDYYYDIYCEDIAPIGIQPGDFEVLASLRSSGSPFQLSPTDIYRSIICSSGGLTKILKRLHKAGLIKRVANKKDKRSSLVKLTAKGKRTIEAAMNAVLKTEKTLVASLTEKEKKQLYQLLSKLLKSEKIRYV